MSAVSDDSGYDFGDLGGDGGSKSIRESTIIARSEHSDPEDVPAIRFADKLVEDVLSGEKTVTVRYDFERRFEAGERVRLIDESGETFALATVATQFRSRAEWIAFGDFAGYEHLKTSASLLNGLRWHYPDAEIEAETLLDVIVFVADDRARLEVATDGGVERDQDEIDWSMYCPDCDQSVTENWDRIRDAWFCPVCDSVTYEDKEEYIEITHQTARFNREHGYGPWWDGGEETSERDEAQPGGWFVLLAILASLAMFAVAGIYNGWFL